MHPSLLVTGLLRRSARVVTGSGMCLACAGALDAQLALPTFQYSQETRAVITNSATGSILDGGQTTVTPTMSESQAVVIVFPFFSAVDATTQVSLDFNPTLSVAARAETAPDESARAFSSATFTYAFEIVGPPGGSTSIPMQMSAAVRCLLPPPTPTTGGGLATLRVWDPEDPSAFSDTISTAIPLPPGTPGGSHMRFFRQWSLLSNHRYDVTMSGLVDIPVQGNGDASGFAVVNPVIGINPVFSDAGLYRMVVSDGLAGPPPPPPPFSNVPEAGTELVPVLLAAGFVLVRLRRLAASYSKSRLPRP